MCQNVSWFQDAICDGNHEALMGAAATMPATATDEGSYYLDTNAYKPYAKGQLWHLQHLFCNAVCVLGHEIHMTSYNLLYTVISY